MTNFIPIFPLGIVVYPGEQVNLHIFEPRYKQLITECYASNKPFGMPVVLDNRLQEYGTLLHVIEIYRVYETGEMDIKIRGQKIFRLLEIVKEVPDKLYSGAIVSYPKNIITVNPKIMAGIMVGVRKLHQIIKVEKEYDVKDEVLKSYDIAHHIGLNINEEYEFLLLLNELQRLEYIKRHLLKMIPLSVSVENLKAKIRQNGHFKNLKGFDFDV
jgi:uncharacterized protein